LANDEPAIETTRLHLARLALSQLVKIRGVTIEAIEAAVLLGASLWCGHYRCGSAVSYYHGGRFKEPYFSCAWHRELEPQYILFTPPDWSRDDGGHPGYDWGPV